MPGTNCSGSLMNPVYEWTTYAFDPIHYFWESDQTRRRVAGALILVFLGTLILVELGLFGLLPPALTRYVGTSRFAAVNAAFTLLLVVEVLELIFSLPCSVSKSVGKQIEVMALFLLRNAFKELSHFTEPMRVLEHLGPLMNIVADGLGAFAIFVLLGVYARLQAHRPVISGGGRVKYCFVAAKKLVALVLLAMFCGMGLFNVFLGLAGKDHFDFFSEFYTLLIFSDILVVLISQRFFPAFRTVFRNSGYALATLVMRLAMTATAFYDSIMGAGAALFVVLLTLAYNVYFAPRETGRAERPLGATS